MADGGQQSDVLAGLRVEHQESDSASAAPMLRNNSLIDQARRLRRRGRPTPLAARGLTAALARAGPAGITRG